MREIRATEIVGKIDSELISDNIIKNVEGSVTNINGKVRQFGSDMLINISEYECDEGAHKYDECYDDETKNEYAEGASIITKNNSQFYRIKLSVDLSNYKLTPGFIDSCHTVITTTCNDYTHKNSQNVYIPSGTRSSEYIQPVKSNPNIVNIDYDIDKKVLKFDIDLYKKYVGSGAVFAPYAYLVSTNVRLMGIVLEPTIEEVKFNDETEYLHIITSNELIQGDIDRNIISLSRKTVDGRYEVRAKAQKEVSSTLTINAQLGSENIVYTIQMNKLESNEKGYLEFGPYIMRITNITPATDGRYKYYGMDDRNFERIAESIVDKYENGRQAITLSVIAGDELYRVGETVIVYGFDGRPIARNANGETKQFVITSAEFVYRGNYRQNLEMIEIT